MVGELSHFTLDNSFVNDSNYDNDKEEYPMNIADKLEHESQKMSSGSNM